MFLPCKLTSLQGETFAVFNHFAGAGKVIRKTLEVIFYK